MIRVAIICARGGSKGVPGKNTRMIAGRPLIAWSIAQALESKLFEHVAVSSDARDILACAQAAGATFLVQRPDAMATDTASVLPAIEHCLVAIEDDLGSPVDSFAFLQATSPTRDVEDIKGAVALFEQHRCTSVVTGCEARLSPYFSLFEETPEGTIKISKEPDSLTVRRQDAPRCFGLNGSVYVVDRASFSWDQRTIWPDTRLFEMSEENSVDIDTPLDFRIAEMIMTDRHQSG